MSDRSWFHIHPGSGLRPLSSLDSGQPTHVYDRDMPPRWQQLGQQVTDVIEDEFFRGLLEHFASEEDAWVRGSLLLSSLRTLDIDRELDDDTVDLIMDSTPLTVEVMAGGEQVMRVVDDWGGAVVLMEPVVAEEFVASCTW